MSRQVAIILIKIVIPDSCKFVEDPEIPCIYIKIGLSDSALKVYNNNSGALHHILKIKQFIY